MEATHASIASPRARPTLRWPRAGKWSLRITIASAFTALFVVAIGVIVIYSYRRNARAILDSADVIFARAGDAVIAKSEHYLGPAATAAGLGAALVSDGTFTIDSHGPLRSYLVEVVRAHPQVVMFYFTHASGNHVGIERKPNGELDYWDLREGANRTLTVYKLASGSSLTQVETRTEFDFRPRLRPWFRLPKHTGYHHWTDAYSFYSSKRQLGITVSYPARAPQGRFLGVVAADIELEELSRFLATLDIGAHGRALVIDGRDQLIAYSEAGEQFLPGHDGTLPTLADLDESWLVAGLAAIPGDAGQARYESGGERFVITQRRLPAALGMDWRIVIAAPEDDFIGGLKQTNRQAVLVAGLILLLGIAVIVSLAGRISRPIVEMARATQRIKEFELGGRIDVRSPIAEIQLLGDSIEAMQTGLAAFGKYVPDDLVRQLLSSQQEVEIGGSERELTLFFSDIEGFTSIAEKMPPRQLAEHVSDYLDALSHVLLDHRATIDKYIGDGIMAFWNAPLPCADHAALACRAALTCQRQLAILNRDWERAGKAVLKTRIGIHTGRTVVGNIGSSRRFDYTAIGDSVNLASRLEGANKRYGTQIIVSQATVDQIGDEFELRPLDRIAVKGKVEPVHIYELLSREGEL